MGKFSFLVKTAIRDSRKNRGKLFLFMSSIILGIAALVAINAFNYNLLKDIDRQAATLLGADLSVNANKPIPPNILAQLDSLPGEKSTEQDFLSMAYILKDEQSQFTRIKALEGDFPYYGKINTEPASAYNDFRQKQGLLVDDGLMIEHDLQVNDSIKLGNRTFAITGRLKSAIGNANFTAGFAPTIYIGQDQIAATGLIKPGSLVDYSHYYKLPEGFEIDTWKEKRRKGFRNENVRAETITDRKENLNKAFDGLNYFLNLVAMVSLLLGCIGVASSVFIYVKNKIPSIAVFRCLGMKGNDAFAIYFIQIFSLGVLGVIIGAILGSAVQVLLPMVLNDFLPFEVDVSISWQAIFEGIGIGALITILFALVPLVSIRKISPLRTLRASFDEDLQPRDPLKWIINLLIVLALFGFLWQLTGKAMVGAIFTGGLLAAFLLLYLTAKGITWLVKRFFPRGWNFVLRQGLSNLFRPNNQTQTLLISIGLGTAVLTNLFIIQGLLLKNVEGMDSGNQPNMILYGIEKEQKEGLAQMTADFEMPIIQQVPIVTMKLEEWKGKTKAEWLADTSANVRRWAAGRELRVTFRDTLDSSEELVSGKLQKGVTNASDSIMVSLGASYAVGLGVELGDELVFNVQGTRIPTYVGSIRSLDFSTLQTRFFIVFPTGVLEEAPQFQILVTKSPDPKTTANYRNEVVRTFPNVSVIDLGLILKALGDILDKVSYIIKFMAAFSILTGLIVLISSLLLSKFQRIKESVLLRTLGASRRQILLINATEYALLGALAAFTGIIISIVGSYLVATYQLELAYKVDWWPIVLVFLIVVILTVVIGLLNSRDVVNRAPLEVLRKEVG